MTTTDSDPVAGPRFATRPPRLNHVAMSLPADLLDAQQRASLVDFWSSVFGWAEIPQMTEDRQRLVFSTYSVEQFVFLIADDEPMRCPRLDHFGFSVGAEDELDEVLARARAFQRRDDRVDIVEKSVDDHGVVAITSIYIGYLLPMMVEVQWWEYRDGDPV